MNQPYRPVSSLGRHGPGSSTRDTIRDHSWCELPSKPTEKAFPFAAHSPHVDKRNKWTRKSTRQHQNHQHPIVS
jgi:hypothetical protein